MVKHRTYSTVSAQVLPIVLKRLIEKKKAKGYGVEAFKGIGEMAHFKDWSHPAVKKVLNKHVENYFFNSRLCSPQRLKRLFGETEELRGMFQKHPNIYQETLRRDLGAFVTKLAKEKKVTPLDALLEFKAFVVSFEQKQKWVIEEFHKAGKTLAELSRDPAKREEAILYGNVVDALAHIGTEMNGPQRILPGIKHAVTQLEHTFKLLH